MLTQRENLFSVVLKQGGAQQPHHKPTGHGGHTNRENIMQGTNKTSAAIILNAAYNAQREQGTSDTHKRAAKAIHGAGDMWEVLFQATRLDDTDAARIIKREIAKMSRGGELDTIKQTLGAQ